MTRYGIIYLHNGAQRFYTTPFKFVSQRHAILDFWGYNYELRSATQEVRVIATLKLILR